MSVSWNGRQQNDLLQLLKREIEQTHFLMDALDAEYAALAEHHPETLADIIQEKHNIVRDLARIDKEREELLRSMNLDPSHPSMKKSAGNQEDDPVASMWQELMELAEKCQQQNRINGSIVELGYQQSRYALDILNGLTPSSELYDQSGHKIASSETHTLAHV